MLFLSLLIPLLVPVKRTPVPMCAQRQTRVRNRQHKDADGHHDSLENHVEHLVIREFALEAFTKLSNAEGTAYQDCDSGDGDCWVKQPLSVCVLK